MGTLFIQLALLLVTARLGAELAKRLGFPAVVGELSAGLLLGPTVFGHYWPSGFASIFAGWPTDKARMLPLEIVGNLGMVLLLLLTGLETDLRLVKNLGRSALIASGSGMALPFGLGLLLGYLLPDRFLADPHARLLFALFLATAMSISAMPVIAKILMDLDLTRRNLGLVILSAGVVDDTAGWLILSVIAGAATHGGFSMAQLGVLGRTLGLTAAFLVAIAFVIYPLLRWGLRVVAERSRTKDTDLVVIILVTFLCAAATEEIGVHAVFGAFIVGTAIRQVPRLKTDTVHRLESFVFAILAPIFFGIVGLKVNLWHLGGGGVLAIVLGVACFGKLVGVTVGGLWGGMRFWEATSIAVAMNARGAMELVVASMGLSLGILNEDMFSVIVVVAVVTSLLAPLGLRLTMRMVRMTDDEAQRLAREGAVGIFDPAKVRVLVPTAGGPNALGAARLAFSLARQSDSPVGVLFVEAERSTWSRVRGLFRKQRAGQGLEQHLAVLKAMTGTAAAPSIRRVMAKRVSEAIIAEAQNEYDLLIIGASPHGRSLGGDILAEVVAGAPCHVAIVRTAAGVDGFRNVIVPTDGSTASRVAVEFAARYAELAGAELTVAILREGRPQADAYLDDTNQIPLVDASEILPTPDEELERISRVFTGVDKKPAILHVDYDPSTSALAAAVQSGTYDLAVIGAENRAVQHRLFFGYDNERLIRSSPISVAVVVPNIARLK